MNHLLFFAIFYLISLSYGETYNLTYDYHENKNYTNYIHKTTKPIYDKIYVIIIIFSCVLHTSFLCLLKSTCKRINVQSSVIAGILCCSIIFSVITIVYVLTQNNQGDDLMYLKYKSMKNITYPYTIYKDYNNKQIILMAHLCQDFTYVNNCSNPFNNPNSNNLINSNCCLVISGNITDGILTCLSHEKCDNNITNSANIISIDTALSINFSYTLEYEYDTFNIISKLVCYNQSCIKNATDLYKIGIKELSYAPWNPSKINKLDKSSLKTSLILFIVFVCIPTSLLILIIIIFFCVDIYYKKREKYKERKREKELREKQNINAHKIYIQSSL